MSISKTRKTLGLPESQRELNPRRKPVRAYGLAESHRKVGALTARTASPVSTQSTAPAGEADALQVALRTEKVVPKKIASKKAPPKAASTVRPNINATSHPELRTGAKNTSGQHRKPRVDGAARLPETPQTRPPAKLHTQTQINSHTQAQTGVRISKLMAERGLCSRREADAYIERGWVYVDGRQITELGSRALPSASISLNKAAQAAQRRQATILLNKPLGYVSGQPEPGCTPAVSLIRPENQYLLSEGAPFRPAHLKCLAPAGRLDVNSTGLLVLTQDGRIARQLVGETSNIEKEYLVRVEGTLDEAGLALLRHGLSLDGKPLRPAKVEPINADQLRFILKEGRKRQIRRMCELVGLRVIGLKRVRIGRVRLGKLPLGQWRYLSEDELF